MRRVASILLASLYVFLVGCGDEAPAPTEPSASSGPRTPVELAELAFEALQADDFELLRPVLPTAVDTLWMMERVATTRSAERQQQTRDLLAEKGGAKAVAEEAATRVRKTFQAAREEAAEVFDWTAAQFGGLVEEKSAVTRSEGLETADVYFLVRVDEHEEIVRLTRCFLAEDRWVVTRGFRFRPNPHSRLEQAQVSMARLHLRTLRDAVTLYETKHGHLPASLEVLMQPDPETGMAIVKPEFVDPWGTPFRVEVVDGAARLTSAGFDKVLDTEDDVVWPEGDAR